MDDCFGDTAIDEDEIMFDFGDGDFESKPSEHQDSTLSSTLDVAPVINSEGVPGLYPWSDPVKDQAPKIESHDFDHRSSEGKSLPTDSSHQVLSPLDERSRKDPFFTQVSLVQDDVILSDSTATSSGNLSQDLFSSNSATSHFENNGATIVPLSQTLEVEHLSPDTAVCLIASSPPDVLHVSSHPPVSISSAFPPAASPPPLLPPQSSPPHPPFSLHPTSQTPPTNSPFSSFPFTEDVASPASETLSIQPSFTLNPIPPLTSDPFLHPISSSPPPHLPFNDADDDEFDFDELVASRTQFKSPILQSSVNVDDANEKKTKKDFPSDDVTFAADFSLPTEGIERKRTEDNGISVLLAPDHQSGQRSEEAFDEASDEWDRVQTIEPEFEEGQTRTLKTRVGTEPITFAEAVAVLDRNKLGQQFGGSIRTSVKRGAVASLFHRLCGGPRLHQRLHAERDFAFCLGACPFNNEDPIHCRVLFSIFKQLTGSKFDCARFGNHWEVIGFQGQDPATDLRGVGFLGLLQLLHLVTDLKTQALARTIYRLSLHETQNFPFSVMGINLTRITIAAMREDCLNKEFNRRGQLLGVINDFYVGLFHRMQVTWKTQRKTIRDTGFVLADLESFAKKHSQEIVRTNVQIQSTVDVPTSQHQDHGSTNTRDIAHIDEHLF